MTAKKKSAQNSARQPAKPQALDEQAPLTLRWELAELPSSQHRAGLAGLVLAVEHLQRTKFEGICELGQRTPSGVSLRVDPKGMKSLIDLVYAASSEDSAEKAIRKNKKKEPIDPIRTETRTELNPKTQREVSRTVYIYPRVVPRGAPVLDLDPSRDGERGLYVKLWRDLVWQVLRGVPAQREPFEARAEGRESGDWRELFEDLTKRPDASLDLPGTYYLGAQAKTADDVAFRDRARYQFLLHFWPFAVTIYVPQAEDREGKLNDVGYSIAIPDVADLDAFCSDYIEAMRGRDPTASRFYPRDALITLPSEGALAFLAALRDRLNVRAGSQALSDLVLGVDVVHALKDGNKVRLKSNVRLSPRLEMVDRYAVARSTFHDFLFRRQQVANLIDGAAWHRGFSRLFAELPHERFIGRRARFFSADACEAFNQTATDTEAHVTTTEAAAPAAQLDSILLRIVTTYLGRRLGARGYEWQTVKDLPEADVRRRNYYEEREKVARNAFLACRSRSGADFVDYFAGTICSVPQHLSEEHYRTVSAALRERPEEVRTLTMLALSARS